MKKKSFFRIMRFTGSLDREEIREMLLEHVQIRSLIFQIEKFDPNSALFQELGELLEKHIRKEERVIFPFIEEALPDDMLEDLAPLLK
ncbi:hemerythrin domain-containing protein [Radiobacillus kanasensis]|uniref:hemerythrin domain-containing protein n=1 Tax=Radiobacillus kanasensis TaxID=2844358 RepID=UPI001E3D281B|nr:hemerythrin domain-containing protein [Radiobacillus kanasensis]UFU01462.1 hemerythrin domain-containing protein [Radiobacillus kanasensis]